MRKVIVAGVGMIPFTKPGASEDYPVMGAKAVQLALKDAGLDWSKMQMAFAGYAYGDTCAGQAAYYNVGQSGIPVINVNNACASGSTGFYLARQAIEAGAIDCAIALGFEQMQPGALKSHWSDRPSPTQRFIDVMTDIQGYDLERPRTAQLFGGAGEEYMRKYGMPPEIFAHISVKARKHAANNPLAIFRTPLTLQEVLDSPQIYGPLTRYQCCPPTCGAAAAIICSEDFARRHGVDTSIFIAAQTMTSDQSSTFDSRDMMELIGYGMSQRAADAVYEKAGISPDEIDVVELHDCFTTNELLSYEALRLTPEGTAEQFILDGDNTYGGKVVTNPSGGLLSKGHPLGATGLAQCTELVQQLRGNADKRQVENAKLALQHNIGIGGACVVTLFQSQ